MVNFHKSRILLEQAMTMELKHLFRHWRTPGLLIQVDNLPENAVDFGIMVSKYPEGNITLHIYYTIPAQSPLSVTAINSFSTLDELKKEYPKLFDITGHLFAIG